MEQTKQIFKELNFLDEKVSNINLEMLSLEKDKNQHEELKAKIVTNINDLEEEKKSILSKTDKYTGLKKYLYMIVQANSDLKNLKIINSKLEENRIELQGVEEKLDIKSKLIKEKMEEKLDALNRREQIYMRKYHEQENQRENAKKENSKDLNNLINLYNLVTQIDFQDKKANVIKEELVKGLNSNIEKYIKENNIQPPKNMKIKNKNKEAENEC